MADTDVATGTWQRAVLAGIAMALVLTMAVTSAASAAPPAGKGRPEAKTQGAAHGAPGAEKGRKRGASKGRKVRRRGSAPSSTKSRSRDGGGSAPREATPPSTRAKAGKTTICHSTGSATNPYVEITVSDNALNAHARHHDGRDIIPAPAEGCEGVAAPGVGERTGSEEAEGGVLGKRRSRRGSEVEAAEKRRKSRSAAGDVRGVEESNVAGQNAAQPVAEEDEEGGSLPLTGLALGALLLTAALLVAGGAAVRRATRGDVS